MGRLTGVLGIAAILGAAYLFSTDRRAIKLKTIAWGLGLQLALGLFVLRVPAGQILFSTLGYYAKHLLDFSYVGSTFVFGEIGKADSNLGLIFAFQVLPTIIFIAAFFAVLYHIGVMQIIIRAAAWVMTVIMGASGAESLNVAASIFMGQTEAPLTIRPFLPKLTKSELMTVMTSGMAHISGGMMAAYIRVGGADAKQSPHRRHHDRPRHAVDGQDARSGNGAPAHRRQSANARRRKKNPTFSEPSLAAPLTACISPSTSAPCSSSFSPCSLSSMP